MTPGLLFSTEATQSRGYRFESHHHKVNGSNDFALNMTRLTIKRLQKTDVGRKIMTKYCYAQSYMSGVLRKKLQFQKDTLKTLGHFKNTLNHASIVQWYLNLQIDWDYKHILAATKKIRL